MTPVDPMVLEPGFRLPCALFTRQGVKLLSEGTLLTDEMVRTLRAARQDDLYMAQSVGELYERRMVTSRTQESVGSRATEDLVTTGGVLALQAGEEVEQHHADAYELGAFRGPESREDVRLRAGRVKLTDQVIMAKRGAWDRLSRTCAKGDSPLYLPDLDEPAWPEIDTLTKFRRDRVEAFRRILARLLAGLRTDAAAPLELVDELIEKLQCWPHRFGQLALLAPRRADYLPDHCYTTAVLSIGIAARFGFSYSDVRAAGLAGLLADAGMALVPRDVRSTDRPLTEYEISRVLRHTAYSVVLLDSFDGLPEAVRLAAYQHHERENGAGYPDGLKSPRITDHARIVAVADAFAAATEPRSYKPPKLPYNAIEELITVGAQRMYDRRVVRALVEVVGLFPIGSFVKLSTGEPAVVVGANPEQIDRPIVQKLGRDMNVSAGEQVIDLADYKPWELHVMRAIEAPRAAPQARRRAG
ncbi:MAG TPA: HD domain-containing phosphohydrolase [Phycisphaerales bacterium]|nr:HD domain-containing phosphohydrolase [Phycisphaerales bacterium]